jgi:hypothetical protein
VVRIIDQAAPIFTGETMGVAAPDPSGGVDAAVFYPRIQKVAHGSLAGIDILLGTVIAHEVGHLLLGNLKHSANGIMCGRWKKKELEMAGLQLLLFTNEEASAIRVEAAARRCRLPGRCGTPSLWIGVAACGERMLGITQAMQHVIRQCPDSVEYYFRPIQHKLQQRRTGRAYSLFVARYKPAIS